MPLYHTGSTAPDVVYTFVAGSTTTIDIDLAGSSYDTKVYIYDENLALVACNDDFYADYTSFLGAVPVMAGVQYFIVVDGYGGDSGDYMINVTEFAPCMVTCHPEAVFENEPPLVDDYIDNYNGGCNTDPDNAPFQHINWANTEAGEAWLCGASGWFLSGDSNFRDTDWFTATFGENGYIEITLESEHPCFLFELGPQDCATVGVLQQPEADCEAPATMTVFGDPGTDAWLWVGPTAFSGPVNEFTYTLTLIGHQWDPPVSTEEASWGGVKALYR